ncbi:MAG: hypothetical protein B6D72_04200 [gamma proteobacterium symbiont of Ctena orbiculata]|nr:MAG: hypothetical protein B6D72_04200 [gamma proteobacterium symbiont of Ctena orbiculata]
MQLIRCTKKLQKEMGLKQPDLCAEEPRFSYLGPWHANLFHIDRRKCVLFINDKTLFNFIVPDVPRSQIKELDKLFKNHLSCVLAAEDFAEEERARILSEYDEGGFANTSSKSVLGSMNDLAFHYKYSILNAGGVHSPTVPEIIRQLNRMPMGSLKYVFPIEALKDLYQTIEK